MSVTHIPGALRRQVRERAGECCEYCRIPESMTWAVHTIDPIIAEKHGGPTVADNLALAGTICNPWEGSDLASIDEQTGSIEPLFTRVGIAGPTTSSSSAAASSRVHPGGRATVRVLRFNDPDRVQERELLVAAGSVRTPDA
jgi:hypothetical protein